MIIIKIYKITGLNIEINQSLAHNIILHLVYTRRLSTHSNGKRRRWRFKCGNDEK